MLCSGASAPEQRLVLLLPPQHENVGPQPPRQRTNPFLFFLFLSQHGIFALFSLHTNKKNPSTQCAPCTARPRRAPGRLAGRGRTPREAGRAGAASLGQDAARWRARGGEAALAPRLGARAPGVVAQRRPRRTRSRRGLPGGGRGEECRPWRRARRGGGARRPLRAGRAVNGHQRQPGSLHRIRTQLFFRVRDHSGRRCASVQKNAGTEQ